MKSFDSQNIYASCTKGLEQICAEELLEKAALLNYGVENLQLSPGSLRFEMNLKDFADLQCYIKTCNRFIWILQSFSARDLPKLFQKIEKIPWGQILLGQSYRVKVTATASRLGNEKRIIQSTKDAIDSYFKGQNPKKFKTQWEHEIRVRINKDLAEVGLDLSGEHLHKRSARTGGAAPLRETYAACVVSLIKDHLLIKNNILDPMCGSATLLIEAANYYKPAKREFSVHYIRSLFGQLKKPKHDLASNSCMLFGNDLDKTVTEKAKSNTESISLKLLNEDILSPSEILKGTAPESIICNLPYNQNIPFSPAQFEQLGSQLKDLQAQQMAVILPEKYQKQLNKTLCYTELKKFHFKNNGIPVVLVHYTKK